MHRHPAAGNLAHILFVYPSSLHVTSYPNLYLDVYFYKGAESLISASRRVLPPLAQEIFWHGIPFFGASTLF